MPPRWSLDQVLALAPDDTARTASARLAASGAWSGTGACGDLVWGYCAGSGAKAYQVVVDTSGPAYKCSCPSRKFPCKHALALLTDWSAGRVPDQVEPADFAAAWKASRIERQDSAAARRREPGVRDEQAAARRADARRSRVAAGLAELELWLHDQVRAGLATSDTYGHTARIAARMVDAQAPGIAATLRRLDGLPASGEGWPARLLGEYGRLHLLARAHAHLDELDAELARTVRTHVGYPVARVDVLATPAVTDAWHVIGTRDILDAGIPTRRVWLHGHQSGRTALLLTFDPNGQFTGSPDAALLPGSVLLADLHFYPGRSGQRAAVGTRHGEAVPGPAPALTAASLDEAWDQWSRALAADPWLREWPVVVHGAVRVGGAAWTFADTHDRTVALLLGAVDAWTLAAVSGGHPVTVAGELSEDGLRPLTAWHGATAVRV